MSEKITIDAYATPAADLDISLEINEKNYSLAKGQKLIIYAVLSYILILPARLIFFPVAILFLLAMVVLGIWGVVKVLKHFEMHVIFKVLIFLSFFIPLVNILTLLVLNNTVTKRLRRYGYDVGFMGAKNPA